MLKIYYSAFTYLVLGLLSGLFYREFTKAQGFPEGAYTQLAVVHTHLLTLGFIVLLIVLLLEKVFALSRSKLFGWFFWLYNAGVVLTAAMMITHGIITVTGGKTSAAISGIAGLGHILLTVSTVLLFLALGKAIKGTLPRPVAAA